MHSLVTDRIETPLGEMVLIANDGVLRLLEFADAEGRVEREFAKRFPNNSLVAEENPFGLSQKVAEYFAGDLHAIDTITTDGGGTLFEQQVW
jgi:methylated-DNA-[protein]-cysteine S-methyltransferase